MNLFIARVWAQATAAPAATGGPALWEQFLPLIVIFLVLYFLMIRPNTKKFKSHQEFLTTLRNGEPVVTSGGILGTVTGITDEFVTLEIADGVRIRILKSQISQSAKEGAKK